MTMKGVYKIVITLGTNEINIPQKDNSLYEYLQESLPICDNEKKSDNVTNTFCIKLNKDSFHDSLYIKILDNTDSSFNFDNLINSLIIGYKYFNKFEISVKINKRLNCWVKSLGKYSYTWTELLDKPNYSLEIYKKRFWPYFNVNSKDWKQISTKILTEEYPNQNDCKLNDTNQKTDIVKEYEIEFNISQKYNNYLGYSVLDPKEYPCISNIIDRLVLLDNLNLKILMFEAILRMLMTPSMCHLIKEPMVNNLINPLFDNKLYGKYYKNIYIHFMYYAMFILHHEDTVMFSQIHRNYRIIFTHSEAICMPQTYKLHLEIDPYIQQLTGDGYLMKSIPYYLRCKRYFYPINIFERRLFLATGGALANIPLHKYKASISGSILIPCLVYCDLEKDFNNVRFKTKRNIQKDIKFNDNLYEFCDFLTQTEKNFVSYLEYYYPSYHSLTDNEYKAKVLTQLIEEEKNIASIDEEKKEESPNLKYNLLSDIDINISTDNFESFDELAKLIISKIQKNCLHIGDVWYKKIYTISSFKYKIYGPGLMRPIDLFRVPYGSDKMVKKFHCPIVRSWYDGANIQNNELYDHNLQSMDNFWKNKAYNNYDIKYDDDDDYIEIESKDESEVVPDKSLYYIGVNIIRSGLCAALSGVNENYKWFFNNKPCCEVILKYAQRGFSTIINEKEKKAMIEYMKTTVKWSNYINKNIDIMGVMNTNHIFFNPCINNDGIRYKLRPFKKSSVLQNNKKQYVGLAQCKTDYGIELNIKNNSTVYHPKINNIDSFVNHMRNIQEDEYSDGDF